MAGFEPATSSLPRKCSTPELHWQKCHLSGRRGSNSRPIAWKAIALSTELLPQIVWAKMDSNHRRHKPADLQSAPFGHSGIRPLRASCRIRTNDPEITNHVLWPTELKRHIKLVLLFSDTAIGCQASAKVQRVFESTKYSDFIFSKKFNRFSLTRSFS